MNAWIAVLLIVVVASAIIGTLIYLRGTPPLRLLGRYGSTWMDHSEDRELPDRPDEDARDDPIPRRPLRVRFK